MLKLHSSDAAHRRIAVNPDNIAYVLEDDAGKAVIDFVVSETGLDDNDKSKTFDKPVGGLSWRRFHETYAEVMTQLEALGF